MFRRLLRPAAAAVAAGAAGAAALCEPPKIPPAVHAELERLRPGEPSMRRKWEEDEDHWHKLPPRAWPPRQPKPDELPTLQRAVDGCAGESECANARFDLATCLAFYRLDPEKAAAEYRALAAAGHADSMVALGIVLLEGIGHDDNPANLAEGHRWIATAAAEHAHPQARYELGCLHYLGGHPAVAEDELAALSLFEAAAADAHAGAQFMTAELLRSGSGGAEDEARAVRLLHAAAVRGHRMARQEVLRLLDADALQQHGAPSSVELARAHAERLPALDGGGEHFGVYRGDGTAATLGELLDAAARSDVVVLGEVHDDPVGHALEAYVLAKLAARRPVALSLEMFDADVQPVVDDYCCGLVSERDFLLDARPWDNYATDYRPLVEFARQCGLRVLAANAPRRYVSAVGRAAAGAGPADDDGGWAWWRPDSWPAAALQWLPPLPLPPLSDDYMEHLRSDPAVVRTDQMGLDDEFAAANHGGGGGDGDGEGRCPFIGLRASDGLLQPMRLWDASMAHAIARALADEPGRLVVHVCGSFHAMRRLGIVEVLEGYRPATSTVVVHVQPEADPHEFVAERHGGLGDFVVLTNAALPRTHDYAA